MKSSILVFSICFSVSLFAQNYDFEKVSNEELQEKFNPQDSSANATYLYKYRKTYFQYRRTEGFSLVTDIHERIKIYNKEGFDYATKEVNLYKQGNKDEEVISIKGYTYNLVNDKLEKQKLEKEAIFKTEQSKFINETKFTMPNIKEGSIVEFKYTINSPFYWNIDDFEFQYDIPVKYVESIFEAPEYFVFKPNFKGFFTLTPEIDKKNDNLRYKVEVPLSENQSRDPTIHYRSGELKFIKNISKYTLSNIPALKDEPYVNNINNYRTSVKYELLYTKFPQSAIENYSTSWEEVVKRIFKNPDFGDELNKTGYYEKDIDAIISSVYDPSQRASIIFNFVKSKVKWNGYYGKYTDDGVRKAYKDQVGNVAEINLMLTSMLRYAGLRAFPVLVSTRQNGIPLFPTREGYNYVVAYVKLPDGIILLDATNKYSTPNVLPIRVLNWQGRVMAEHGGSELIDLYPKEISKISTYLMVNLDDKGTVKGDYRLIKTNHNAMLYREEYLEANKEQYLDKLENKYKGMEISDFEVKNDVDLSKPVIENYKFVKESQADVIGDKIYFSPLFFLKTSENLFKLEKREFPVDFGFPTSKKYMITINLPEGYKIETIPDVGAMALPDDLGTYSYNITSTGNKIQVVIDATINQPIILPVYYDALKAYFSKIIEKEAEQIVLTKI